FLFRGALLLTDATDSLPPHTIIVSACSKHSDSNFSPLCHGRIAIVFDNLGSISAKVWTNRAGIIGSANDVLPNVGDLTSNPIMSVHNCMPGTLPENIWNIKSGP